jgi:hypothetical protein
MVRLECNKCSAAISIRIADWQNTPYECPACRETFHHGSVDADSALAHVAGLSRAIRGALMGAARLPFKVRFELDRPKS